MFRHLTVFLILVLSTSLLNAQKLSSFSEDPNEFIAQLDEFMNSSKMSDVGEIFEVFETAFKGGMYSETEIPEIISTANAMLGLKMNAKPYFTNYLDILGKQRKGESAATLFTQWHKVYNDMLSNIVSRKLTPVKDFLVFSKDFYSKNTLRYSKAGVSWFTDSYTFDMTYQDGGPKVIYKDIDLYGSRKKDTIIIMGTSGTYDPIEKVWLGKGGRVNWTRTSLGEEVYCDLSEYKIDAKRANYDCKNAVLNYNAMFGNKKVEGYFSDKLVAEVNSDISYPRFESRDTLLALDNIGAGVSYQGGFRLQGTTVYGFGSKYDKAKIKIVNVNNQTQFKGSAELFVIRKGERIVGEKVETAIFFGQDSIYHPSVNIKFEIETRDINLNRGKRGSDRNPFFTSYHQMNIDAERIDWNLDSDSLFLDQKNPGFAKAKNQVIFESLEYFEEGDYRRLQNISSTNPIATIKLVVDEEGSNFLSANNLAVRLNPRFDVTSIQSLLYDLVARGFVNYDSDQQIVEVKDKVFHYANAYQKSVDFDGLKIESRTKETHGILNPKTKSIATNGVSSIEFSPIQRVAVRPYGEFIEINQNRNMDFDGTTYAGMGILEGKNFTYVYDKHHIAMDSIRYFDLFIPSEAEDEQGNPIALSIASRLEHTSGVLLIDAPTNKSGRKDLKMFPSFNTNGPSYVYYDGNETKGGTYKRDSFYFRVSPFHFNSLDDFTREDVQFKGVMVSADIFPEFKETLVLQEDESLGFQNKTPEEGMSTYQDKGNFKGEASLSNEGFLGTGSIDYLGASFESNDVIFKPKGLTATAKRFDHEENRTGIETPQAVGYDVSIDWRPYNDSMYITAKERPFELFKANNHTLAGKLILTPGGLKGRGNFDWDKGTLSSSYLSFGANSVESDTANLEIKALGSEDLAFDTRNVYASLNFDKQSGLVRPNSDDLSTTMPYNQYQTAASELLWNMKESQISIINDKSNLGLFRSIHPDQDSLSFEGAVGTYDLNSNILQVSGVPVLQVCDAFIYTEDGEVEIQPGAIMTPLKNAQIVADTATKYHVINRATVNVLGKKSYKASGFYQYDIGTKKQEIEFADILGTRVGKGNKRKKKTATRALGEVAEADNFYIDKKTGFRGKIKLDATRKELEFDGYAYLDTDKLPKKSWFSIQSLGDKKDLAITYDVPKDYDGQPCRTGLFINRTTGRLYPSIMTPLYLRKDRPIIDVKGIFKYNSAQEMFIFGDSSKISTGLRTGERLIYKDADASVEVEGVFNIGEGLDYMNVWAAGIAKTNYVVGKDVSSDPIEYEVKADLMAGIDIEIPDKLMKMVQNDFKSSSYDALDINYKIGNHYEHAIAEKVDNSKDMAKVVAELLNGNFVVPKKYNKHTFFFSQLPMTWVPDYQSFVSRRGKLGLYSINGEVLDKAIEAYVEFRMPATLDDRCYVYLKSPSGNFYFFGYQKGVLSTVSSDPAYNDMVLNLKKKEREINKGDDDIYEILPVNEGTANMFLNRVRTAFD